MSNKIFGTIAVVLILWGLFGGLRVPEDMVSESYEIFGMAVPHNSFVADEDLTLTDGLLNGSKIFGASVRNMIVESWDDYTDGFDSFFWNAIWLFIGIPIVLLWNFLGTFIILILISIKLLFIKASVGYYIGYLVAIIGGINVFGRLDD